MNERDLTSLADCPFCGKVPEKWMAREYNFERRYVYCDCGARSPSYATNDEAIKWWNTRLAAQPAPDAGYVAGFEALAECVSVLELVEHQKIKDPAYGEAVRALGDRIGYGALMCAAQAEWRARLVEDGDPVGGEFVAGPCYVTVLAVLKQARSAIAALPATAKEVTVEELAKWPSIQHKDRPLTADDEARMLKDQIRTLGPEIVATSLLQYARSFPSQGSMAGHLWVIGEFVSNLVAAITPKGTQS